MSDRKRGGSWNDPLDDMEFEEFELREPDDWTEAESDPSYEAPSAILTCPSCGIGQSASNRHCEQCGARLGHQRIAVAAPPLRSVSAGGRALGIIVVVIAAVVIAALIFSAIRGGDEPAEGEEVSGDTTSSTTTTSVALGPLEKIRPISVTCSSEYNSTLGCPNLIDGQDSYWNDQSNRGEDAWIKVTFVNPVALEQVLIINVDNEEKFRRNYRIRAVEIFADDIPGVPFLGEIPNANDRYHPVPTPTNHTLELEILVTATWPSEALGGGRAFDELAVQELEFWGRVQDATPATTGTTAS